MFFTDEAFVWLAGTFFFTVFFVHHLPWLQRQWSGIAMRANVQKKNKESFPLNPLVMLTFTL